MMEALVSTLTLELWRNAHPATHPCASRLLEDRDKTLPHLPCPSLEELGGAFDPYQHPAFEEMLTAADDMVKQYRSDWGHDLRTLARTSPETPFVWFAYPSGTLIFTAASVRDAVMAGWQTTFHRIPETVGGWGGQWYAWTGRKFVPISPESAERDLYSFQSVLFPAAVA